MANEEILDEEEANIFCLTDENGNDVELELIDSITYEDREYLIMVSPEEEIPEVVILEVDPRADGTEFYLTVKDQNVLDAVYGIFKERFKDILTFND